MTEQRGNGGRILADHSSYSRDRLEPLLGSDRAAEQAMKFSSHDLLRALWDQHPAIMRGYERGGLQVRRV